MALTDCAAFIVTLHEPVPLHAPLHPENVEPRAGVAVSVTVDPAVNDAVHCVPHEMRLGVLATVPVPVPLFVTVSAYDDGVFVNVAVTVASLVTAIVQTPVPLHAPLQPSKCETGSACAESVTVCPDAPRRCTSCRS